jgi:hypothetical protein
MIINEHNNIIGIKTVLISESGISDYFYFKRQCSYIIKELKSFFYKITPKTHSPPSEFFTNKYN